MYNERMELQNPINEPDHLSIATSFSNEIMDRFNLVQVNEIVHHVRKSVRERREAEFVEAEKQLAHLQSVIHNLNSNV